MTDHPEYRSLLAAVLATPADDLPRLVLADWLEEHGDPDRAEFIRAQCELDRHPHAARIRADLYTDAEGVRPEWQDGLASVRRTRELWPAVSGVMAGMLGAGAVGRYTHDGDCILVQGQSVVYEVRRGFVSAVRCRLADWFGRGGSEEGIGPRLVREHPIERVVMTDRVCSERVNQWTAVEGTDDIPLVGEQYVLPWAVATRLTGATDERNLFPDASPFTSAVVGWRYPTSATAHAALSAAAIAWAAAEPAPEHG